MGKSWWVTLDELEAGSRVCVGRLDIASDPSRRSEVRSKQRWIEALREEFSEHQLCPGRVRWNETERETVAHP